MPRRFVGVEERNPAAPVGETQQSIPGASHSVPLSLRTTSLQQTSSSRDGSGCDPGRRAPMIRLDPLTSVVHAPPRELSQKKRFFEVCINTGNHAVRLHEINLDCVTSD
jgi:hypothetical protein